MAQTDTLGTRTRKEFPLFAERPIAFLDSAASAQKPFSVLAAMDDLYRRHYANVHRGVYSLSQEATDLYEQSREKVRAFLNAKSEREIIFTRGTTEAINLVAYSWGRKNLKRGDEIVTTILEHHSNFVPWQLLAQEIGAKIHYVKLDEKQSFSKEAFLSALTPRTKLVTFTALANALGVELPVKELAAAASAHGAVSVVDAAQAAPHMLLDVQDLGVDFLALSGHKIYGPTGVGVLYGREELLEEMPPFLSGGDMIRSVSIEETTFNELPYKFEAGTPATAEVIGLGAAVDFIQGIGLLEIRKHETLLVRMLEQELEQIPGVQILGPTHTHSGLVTFTTGTIHPHDIAQFLDRENVAIRAGHHCAQPLLRSLGHTSTSRASVGVYNTFEDIKRLREGLEKALAFFA